MNRPFRAQITGLILAFVGFSLICPAELRFWTGFAFMIVGVCLVYGGRIVERSGASTSPMEKPQTHG